MRNTKQRSLILKIINDSSDHLNTDQIYNIARKNIDNISLGTVYRNLNQLVETKKIMRIKTNEGLDRFDNLNVKHHHFVCDKCHNIIDIFDKINLNLTNINGNIVTDYEIKFRGICRDCIKKEENNYGIKRK